MSSPIRPANDLGTLLMYAPPWAREKLPVRVTADAPPIDRPTQYCGVDPTVSAVSPDPAVLDSRRRLSLEPEIVPLPKSLKGSRGGALIALRLSAVTAIAALVAWVVVTIPGIRQHHGNDNVHAAVLPNRASSTEEKLPTVAARLLLNGDHEQVVNGVSPNGGQKERPSGTANELPVAGAFPPVTASSPTLLQPEKITTQPDNEGTFALIKLGQEYLRNRDFASARLLLKRAAESGSAAAALSLGETFDPLIIQRLGAFGVQPDAVKAQEWYERAAQLGSEAASHHLAKLAQPPQ
jgi:hypothetical protein